MSAERDNWEMILDSLVLNSAQTQVAERFLENPKGRNFLPLAKVFLQHELPQEALELLFDGVQRDPQFGAARVFLAENLLGRGQFVEALRWLKESPIELNGNVTALYIRISCHLLQNDRQEVDDLFFKYRLVVLENRKLSRLGDLCRVSGHQSAKVYLQEELGLKVDEEDSSGDDSFDLDADWSIEEARLPEESLRHRVGGFVKNELSEVLIECEKKVEEKGSDLDSETLAELYAQQGHHDKSVAMYRRMLKTQPFNENWIRRIREEEKLAKKQMTNHISGDVIDALEGTDFIESQMGFYREILEALDCPQK